MNGGRARVPLVQAVRGRHFAALFVLLRLDVAIAVCVFLDRTKRLVTHPGLAHTVLTQTRHSASPIEIGSPLCS